MLCATLLVRAGQDQRRAPVRDASTGRLSQTHTLPSVYTEMLWEIASFYPGLPDPRTLRMHEIRFFYDGMRGTLKQATRKRKS